MHRTVRLSLSGVITVVQILSDEIKGRKNVRNQNKVTWIALNRQINNTTLWFRKHILPNKLCESVHQRLAINWKLNQSFYAFHPVHAGKAPERERKWKDGLNWFLDHSTGKILTLPGSKMLPEMNCEECAVFEYWYIILKLFFFFLIRNAAASWRERNTRWRESGLKSMGGLTLNRKGPGLVPMLKCPGARHKSPTVPEVTSCHCSHPAIKMNHILCSASITI